MGISVSRRLGIEGRLAAGVLLVCGSFGKSHVAYGISTRFRPGWRSPPPP